MGQNKKHDLIFEFECEHCGENWSDNLLNLIDQCTQEELEQILTFIQSKK